MNATSLSLPTDTFLRGALVCAIALALTGCSTAPTLGGGGTVATGAAGGETAVGSLHVRAHVSFRTTWVLSVPPKMTMRDCAAS